LRQEEYDRLVQEKNKSATEETYYQEIANHFRKMNGYKNTAELADDCEHLVMTLRYNRLIHAKNKAVTKDEYQNLAQLFRDMNGYNDTTALAEECENQWRILKERYINKIKPAKDWLNSCPPRCWHCGGKIGGVFGSFYSNSCKSCGKRNNECFLCGGKVDYYVNPTHSKCLKCGENFIKDGFVYK